MKRILIAALLLGSSAHAGESIPIMPEIPTEAAKIEALRLGYILNGFSMVRAPSEGSIDLTTLTTINKTPGVVRTIPITQPPKVDLDVPKEKPPEKLEKRSEAVTDVCTRHGMRKVVTGSSWRCRK